MRARRALFALAVLSAAGLGCPRAPRPVAYDLAERLPYAERWSARPVIVFGTPAAEPQQAEGFYREGAPAEGDPFAWSKGEAEVSLAWPEVAPRAAVVDLAPYERVKGQSVEIRLNGTEVARIRLNDVRYRYAFALPATAQRAGENRIRFLFAATASPSDDPRNPDRRQLAAGFYSLTVAAADDQGLQDLLAREAPRPFAAMKTGGVPTLVEVGPSVVRYALKLPAGAELRFTPDLHPAARAAGASASLRVTVEDEPGQEREVWSAVLSARQPRPAEVRVALPGEAGRIVRVGLHVGGAPGARFLWGQWEAPRVLGGAGAPETQARPSPGPGQLRQADALRDLLRGANVLLVVLDAARADHFGAYGYARATSPNVDRIAREGVVFERVFTPAVYTLGAMASVWTSQYPDRHHQAVSFAAPLPRDRLTLAELLGAQGIHTAGFVANLVAGGFNGFDRGFAEFHETWKEHGSRGDVFRGVVPPWLATSGGRRFFAYVHFREPHQPYNPPPPFDTRFGPAAPLPAPLREDPLAQQDWIKEVNQGRRPLGAAERDHVVRLYDGNIALADDVIGSIRQALEKDGLWERTVVIVTGDHGEALFEHGWIGHNTQLYDESAHVPLVVRFPSAAGLAGRRISALADLLDLGPTIADLFGALGRGGSDREFQGRSLLPVLFGAEGEQAVLSRTVWERPLYAQRDARYKLVYDTRTGAEQLFDLASDPAETREISASEPLRAAWARESLHHWIAQVSRRTRTETGAAPGMTREQCESLKSMGYLGTEFPCPAR